MNPLQDQTENISELMLKLKAEKKSAKEYVERRYDAWNENYELYKNKVKTNRLTQRQNVNIPLMKETIKTLLSKVDDPPTVDWKELNGDDDKEIIVNELWNNWQNENNVAGVDIQDKKTVLLYGRGFKKLNWIDGDVKIRALDVYDVIVDPLTDPLDIETARFIIHQNIFKPLREILTDKRYNKEGKDKLKTFLSSREGLIQSNDNKKAFEEKMERMSAMGINDDKFPLWAGGDQMVQLTEHYTNIWNGKEYERRVIVYAEDSVELLNEKLTDLMGTDFYPFVTWGEDMESQDFWSDAPADLVRTPNKVVNIWFSQLVENRTLRNFQMHWYDATQEGYSPQTYEPGPGRMLPAPGDPNKTVMPVDIQGLDETLTAIQFLTTVIERGTAATAIEKGQSQEKPATLGEINILVGNAMERVVAMSKMYRRSWQELAQKWIGILEANFTGKQTLYKQDRNGTMWPKVIYGSDWKSDAGWKPIVSSSSEQEKDDTKLLQKFQFLLQQFPTNTALKTIAQKRMLQSVDMTPDEIKQVEESEKQQAQLALTQGQPEQGQPSPYALPAPQITG